ncbi:cytochrome b [Mesorhizobium atlanticum]
MTPWRSRSRVRASLTDGASRCGAYTQITIVIHWLTALLVVLASAHRRGRAPCARRPALPAFHPGPTVLLLVVPRLLARWLGAAPRVEDPQSRWMDLAARAGHTVLYLFLIALPLSGWYAASRLGIQASLLGVDLPALAAPVQGAPGLIADLHGTGGTLILWLAGAHALIAMWHQFVMKDGTLERMNPLTSNDLADSRE